ncbi:PP2C family serine/threonine-protein phosphatase [Neobacillus sp. NRS-1170]|uniref:PP2C family serine/threonine-protein phosphatase n=1 Tax=Neobacillus sp. NRS-1170 TaxID=3233898 RepID=UPI003D2BF63F
MLEREANEHIQALAYQIQKRGNWCNGDSYFMKATEEYFICTVADGLGSGAAAHASSNAIREVVEKYHHEDVDALIDYCNQALKNKRGATISIFKVNFSLQTFSYCSVGNIRFVLYCPSGRFIYPLPVLGFLSGKPQNHRSETFSYEGGSTFIIHTDGLMIPSVKQLLSSCRTIEDMSNQLELYTNSRMDDLTYVVGELL